MAIQDTTVVKSEGGGGLYLHPTILVDRESGAILGLAHAEFLHREAGRRANRRAKPVAEKESQRWLAGAQAAARVGAEAREITVVADRESDIFAAFAQRPATAHLLVRAAHDRALEEGARLFAHLDGLPEAGRAELPLPARPGRPARVAKLSIRFAPLTIRRPRNGVSAGLPETISVHVVDVREIDPPAGENVHWRLVTTRTVESLDQALETADLYRLRWMIEQLFRTMKTEGFDIEAARIADDAPRQNLVAATLIAAITAQQLVHARDGGPGPLRPLEDAFEPEDIPLLEALCVKLEGRTERQKNPHPQGSLAWASWVCARLGGWTGYYGKPGPVVMLRGWRDIQTARLAAQALKAIQNV